MGRRKVNDGYVGMMVMIDPEVKKLFIDICHGNHTNASLTVRRMVDRYIEIGEEMFK